MSRVLGSTFCVLAFVTMALAGYYDRNSPLDMSFDISGVNIDWPGADTRKIYETYGRFIPRNIIATRAQIYKDEAIVAFPRYKTGVPFTLGVVGLSKKGQKTVVSPFPCWAIQEEGNCEALQSVVDIALDVQDILWVLDVGIVNTHEQPVRRCPPKVVAINVKTGKVVKLIDLSNLVSSASRLHYITVDYANDGKVYLYITDSSTRAIISYDVTENRGFRVILPKAVTHDCPRADILFTSLVRKNGGQSVIYFTYLCSSRMFSIRAENLRRGSTSGSVVDRGPKPNKIVLLGTDNGNAIFFRNRGQSDVYLWNTETKFSPDNFILAQKGNECRLPTQITPGYKKLMWTIESNFQDYIQNTVGCTGASVVLHPLVKSAEDC